MEKLKHIDALLVRQKKEWGEILTGFETKNKYTVNDITGNQLYWAAEESSFLSRMFLKKMRPFNIHILSRQGERVLKFSRPFRFFIHEISVFDLNSRQLGTIKQKFAIFSKRFIVRDEQGREIYSIFGPFFHPWTFKILQNDTEVGKISKKWSGFGKEIFTDADNFNVAFRPGIDVNKKAVLLGALFLIDMLYFEKSD